MDKSNFFNWGYTVRYTMKQTMLLVLGNLHSTTCDTVQSSTSDLQGMTTLL